MARRAALPVSLAVLREVLGLPEHLTITGVIQTYEDRQAGEMRVMVSGPFCPDVDDSDPAPEISVVYQRVDIGAARVLSIHGLDT